MRPSSAASNLLRFLVAIASQANVAHAGPLPNEDARDLGFIFQQRDACAGTPCGSDGQYCCAAGQGCYTSYSNAAPIAYCSTAAPVPAATGGASYAVYTTVVTETDFVLRTSIYTSYFGAPSATAVICNTGAGETSCGSTCCPNNYRCTAANVCSLYTSSYLGIPYSSYLSTASNALRPTSGGVSTKTSTVSATTTQPFQTPATATGSTIPPVATTSNHGLSGGAIAGIVIGVIAGIILLLLICFCCILSAGIEGLLALFGLGKKKRRSTERIETVERYSRHGSHSGSRRETHTGWFGRPTRVTERKEKSSGLGGLGWVGAGLIGLAAVLGLKRMSDNRRKTEVSDYSYSYTDSYTGTSASSASSAGRDTRRSSRR